MQYSKEEVMQYVQEEDVKFIRLAFCDIYGKQKNISIMPTELKRAFATGVAIDGSAIRGFEHGAESDLILHPEPNTLAVLPWRPEHGRVVRMFCTITFPDGTPYPTGTRSLLIKAIADAKKEGIVFAFGSELEFYLLKLDENGNPTKEPYDNASYMDIAPEDKGENVRREICLTLERMGIQPESSHHEEGPGQNEIDFRFSDPLSAADHATTFKTVVQTVAARNGLWAEFGPKPLKDAPGNGYHVNVSAKRDGVDRVLLDEIIAGIMNHIKDMTVFLNTTKESYERLGQNKAPKYVSWSKENRSQLIRIPAAEGKYERAELRSPDPLANPYLVFALIIYAVLDAIKSKAKCPEAINENLYIADKNVLDKLEFLPQSLEEAKKLARKSAFIQAHLSKELIDAYCK